MRNWVNGPPLNYAAGLEIGTAWVRAIVLGYGTSTPHAPPWIRLVHAACVPIPDGVLSGADILEPRLVARALVDVFGGPDEITRWSGTPLALGLPPSVVLIRSVAMSELVRRGVDLGIYASRRKRGSERGLDAFEERVICEAEHLMRRDRSELCVDWYRTLAAGPAEHATIVATTRQHVESRVGTAAMAGLRVAIVDGDAEAALRACRYCAHAHYPAASTYVVMWIHANHARTWCIYEHAVEVTLEGDTALELRRVARWARERGATVVIVASDEAGRTRHGFAPDELVRETGCLIEQFTLSRCCTGFDPDKPLIDDEGFAVAFGLALRSVI